MTGVQTCALPICLLSLCRLSFLERRATRVALEVLLDIDLVLEILFMPDSGPELLWVAVKA